MRGVDSARLRGDLGRGDPRHAQGGLRPPRLSGAGRASACCTWFPAHEARKGAQSVMTMSLLSAEQLRQQVRVRLAQGRLPSVDGVYKNRRGTGRPCMVCRRLVEAREVECDETDRAGAVLVAHEACYMLWREESVSWQVPRRP
jgi:hypothetical protein